MNIPLQAAKETIIYALNNFDVDLGRRASEILYNQDRLNLVEVFAADKSMMACRPAGITIQDLKGLGMYMPNFEEKYGPHFTQQDNPQHYAIIDFEYDGSETSFKYLAHELGHAIADDMQREQGKSFRDFSMDELERQAYFVQNIVEHHAAQTVADYDPGQDFLRLSFERAAQVKAAAKVFEQALHTGGNQRVSIIHDVMIGGKAGHEDFDRYKPSKLPDVPKVR